MLISSGVSVRAFQPSRHRDINDSPIKQRKHYRYITN